MQSALASKGYQTASVCTVDKLRVVILCYEGCIANASRAIDEMKKGNIAEKGIYLGKATAIVSELMSCLDKEQGGDVAERLESLYLFVLNAFSRANLKNDPALIEGALRVLKELKEGWVELSQKGVGA